MQKLASERKKRSSDAEGKAQSEVNIRHKRTYVPSADEGTDGQSSARIKRKSIYDASLFVRLSHQNSPLMKKSRGHTSMPQL